MIENKNNDGSIKYGDDELSNNERNGYRIRNGIKECKFCGTPENHPPKYNCCDYWRF